MNAVHVLTGDQLGERNKGDAFIERSKKLMETITGKSEESKQSPRRKSPSLKQKKTNLWSKTIGI